MYIVDFTLENGMEISYVFNITKHDKYFLQRMRPYAMVQASMPTPRRSPSSSRRTCAASAPRSTAPTLRSLWTSPASVQLSQELENLFLHYNVDKVTLDEMNGTLSRMMMHLEQLQKQLPPVVPEPCRKQKND